MQDRNNERKLGHDGTPNGGGALVRSGTLSLGVSPDSKDDRTPPATGSGDLGTRSDRIALRQLRPPLAPLTSVTVLASLLHGLDGETT